MADNATRDDLETARVELVEALPLYLSILEKKQIRDFLEGAVNLRRDEVASGFDLYQALLRNDYAPYPWRQYTDLLYFVHNVFETRTTAALYRDDLQGFREYWDYVGSEYERESTPAEIQVAWEDTTHLGFADKWEWKLYSFTSALESYWGDVDSGYLGIAVQETVQVLCFPVFAEKVAEPILKRWAEFSDKFREMTYYPRKRSEFGIQDSDNKDIYF